MSNRNQRLDRGPDGKLLRKYRRPTFSQATPWWWRNLFMTRLLRRENAYFCMRILKGDDPDGIAFPVGNRKPHHYYW